MKLADIFRYPKATSNSLSIDFSVLLKHDINYYDAVINICVENQPACYSCSIFVPIVRPDNHLKAPEKVRGELD